MSGARPGPPLHPLASASVLCALTLLVVGGGERAIPGVLLGAIVGTVLAALGRARPAWIREFLVLVQMPVALVLAGPVRGLGLMLVPWLVRGLLLHRAPHAEALLHAIAALAAFLALPAGPLEPAGLVGLLTQATLSLTGIALAGLRSLEPGRVAAAAPSGGRSAGRALLIAGAVAGAALLLFAGVPRSLSLLQAGELLRSLGGGGGGEEEEGPGTPRFIDAGRELRPETDAPLQWRLRVLHRGRGAWPLETADLYLKREVYERTNGHRWWSRPARPESREDAADGAADGFVSLAPGGAGDGAIEQELEALGGSDRFALLSPPMGIEATSARVDPEAGLFSPAFPGPVPRRYRARSESAPRPPRSLIEGARAAPGSREVLEVAKAPRWMKELARELRSRAAEAGAFCLAVESHVQAAAPYARSGLPGRGEPVANLLLRRQGGICQTYAMAMAMLCRMEDVPARIAVGWHRSAWNEGRGAFEFPSRPIHAWVEAKLEGLGWVLFDPTPPAGEADAEVAEAANAGRRTGRRPIASDDAEREPRPSSWEPAAPGNAPWLLLAGLVLVALPLLLRGLRRRSGSAASPPGTAAGRRAVLDAFVEAYLELRRALGRAGLPVRASMTPREVEELSRALEPEGARAAARELVAAYEAARFSPRPPRTSRPLDTLLRRLRA